jgi:hypothetical protein
MPDVLCMHHSGIRCGMPPGCVLGVSPLESYEGNSWLWKSQPEGPRPDRLAEERALYILTAAGPRTIAAYRLELLSISVAKIWPIPPLVRDVLPGPHVVGLAEIDERLIWLVDPKRFRPPASIPGRERLG